MRKLASIQRISALEPIPGADRVEVASMGGLEWKVVVQKGLYQVGDLALYMEIDSVPPDTDVFSWLWVPHETCPAKFHIQTKRFRGQLSQGLLTPLSELRRGGFLVKEEVGLDHTEALGVTKYEPPLPAGSDDIVGGFVSGLSKTDEDRIQSFPEMLNTLRGRPYVITVKADGASMTLAIEEDEFRVYGRKYQLKMSNGPYWRAALEYEYAEWLFEHPSMALQGELVGPGVQRNGLGLSANQMLIFNVVDRVSLKVATWTEMKQFIPFPTVELFERGHEFGYSIDELLHLAEGKYKGTKNEREGIVVRDNDGLEPRVSFKVVSNRFLIRGGD